MKKLFFAALFFLTFMCCGGGLFLSFIANQGNDDVPSKQEEAGVPKVRGDTQSENRQTGAADNESSSPRKARSVELEEVEIDDSLLLELEVFSSHMVFVAIENERLTDLPTEAANWAPLKPASETVRNALRNEVSSLRAKLENAYSVAPPQVRSILGEMVGNLDRGVNDPNLAADAKEVVIQLDGRLHKIMKPATSGSSIPESELLMWTKERIIEYANFPSTVKFGWFPDVLGSANNDSARVIGSFKASNAFGLELKNKYIADWEVSDAEGGSRTWQMISLAIDGKVVFESADAVSRWTQELVKASRIGKEWKGRRDSLAKAFSTVTTAVDDWQRWQREAREFVGDTGTTIEARFDSFKQKKEGTIIILEKSDGAKLTVPMERFSDNDKTFLASKIRSPQEQNQWETEARIFTSAGGSTVKALLKSAKGSGADRTVTLEAEDGQKIQVKLVQLSSEDQKFISDEFARRRRNNN